MAVNLNGTFFGCQAVLARRGELVAKHPLGRLGRPDEIAAAALYLASDGSRAVMGADFLIDGGYTAH